VGADGAGARQTCGAAPGGDALLAGAVYLANLHRRLPPLNPKPFLPGATRAHISPPRRRTNLRTKPSELPRPPAPRSWSASAPLSLSAARRGWLSRGARAHRAAADTSVPVLPDSTPLPAAPLRTNLLIIGGPGENAWAAQLQAHKPLRGPEGFVRRFVPRGACRARLGNRCVRAARARH